LPDRFLVFYPAGDVPFLEFTDPLKTTARRRDGPSRPKTQHVSPTVLSLDVAPLSLMPTNYRRGRLRVLHDRGERAK